MRGWDEPSPTDYHGVVTGANDLRFDTDILDVLSQRVMVDDGAMGTQLQAADLTLDDFRGLESCNEIRPDVIEDEIRSAAIWFNRGYYYIAYRIRELSLKGAAIATRVGVDRSGELGVKTTIGW